MSRFFSFFANQTSVLHGKRHDNYNKKYRLWEFPVLTGTWLFMKQISQVPSVDAEEDLVLTWNSPNIFNFHQNSRTDNYYENMSTWQDQLNTSVQVILKYVVANKIRLKIAMTQNM